MQRTAIAPGGCAVGKNHIGVTPGRRTRASFDGHRSERPPWVRHVAGIHSVGASKTPRRLRDQIRVGLNLPDLALIRSPQRLLHPGIDLVDNRRTREKGATHEAKCRWVGNRDAVQRDSLAVCPRSWNINPGRKQDGPTKRRRSGEPRPRNPWGDGLIFQINLVRWARFRTHQLLLST